MRNYLKLLWVLLSVLAFSVSCGDKSSKTEKGDDDTVNDIDGISDDNSAVSDDENEVEDADYITGDSTVLEFGSEIVGTYPLIFRNTFYILTYEAKDETHDVDYGSGEIITLPVVNKVLNLHAYDIKTLEKKWTVKVGEYALDIQNNLVAVGDTIAVVSSYTAKPWEDINSRERRKISFIQYKTGEIFFESEDLTEWPVIKCSGKEVIKKTNNQNSAGDLLTEDGLLIFSESGFGVSFCSGKLAFTDLKGTWKLTQKEMTVENGVIYLFDDTSSYDTVHDFMALRISGAVAKLKSCEDKSIIYTIPFLTSEEYAAVSSFVINGDKIYFTYQKTDLSYFLGVFDKFTGEKLKEFDLSDNKNNLKLNYGINFKPVIAGNRIIVHGGSDTLGDGRYFVFDIETGEKISEIPFVYADANENSELFLGDSLYRLGSDGDYVEKTGYEDGSVQKISVEGMEKDAVLTNFIAFNAFEKNVFITKNISQSGNAIGVAKVFVLKNQDFTGAKLQKAYNNNGNSVVNTEDPSSNVSCSTALPENMATEDFSSQPAVEEADHSAADKSEDVSPEDSMLYPDLVDLIKYETAYVPLLKKVYFSTNGETSGTGEGGIKLSSQFTCIGASGCSCHEAGSSVKLFYPFKIYMPLHEKDKNNGAPYLTYHPDIPMYYGVFEDMSLMAKRKMFLSYNGYEHDTEDIIDKIENNIGDVFDIALALVTNDYCALVENVLSIAEKSLQPVDENYGSPFITIEKQTGTETNVFGIKTGEKTGFYTVEATDEPSNMQAAVGTMHDVTSAVCDVIDIVNDPANPGNFSTIENMSGSLLKEKSGRYTEGDIEINRKQLIPLKNLTVKIDNIETVVPSSIPSKMAVARVGIIGEDYTKAIPEDNVDNDKTPFKNYVKTSFFDAADSVNKMLFDEDFSVAGGVAGVYVEIGLQYNDIANFRFINAGAYSQTFFFEDILYGSWERNGTTNVFTKSVVKRIKSIESDSFVYLTLTAEIN
ncbi:MAG TPA: hypothetical protein PKG52_12585 [bacterium]|nr:hypothetical protein [bacterium]